jgi:hypothetical protein
MRAVFAFPLGDEASVVELGFCVQARELAVLEAAAHRAGITIGQLTRQLICDFIDRTDPRRISAS